MCSWCPQADTDGDAVATPPRRRLPCACSSSPGTRSSPEPLARRRPARRRSSYRRGRRGRAADAAALARRHDALCAARRRHLPFESRGGEIAVLGGVLRVAPPYTERSCTCENETVLGRFFALLEALDAEGAAEPG